MTASKTSLVWLVLALFWLLPGNASAQWWYLAPWEGELEFGGEYTLETTETGKDEQRFKNFGFDERLRIRDRGFILHPSLFSFTGGLTVGLLQDKTSIQGEDSSVLGRALGYSFTGQLLSQKPYRLFLFGNRSANTVSRDFGRSDTFFENLGATLYLKYSPFPSRLGYRQEKLENRFRSLGLLTIRGEERDIIFYSGSREWDFSSLDIDYQMDQVEDLFQTDLDYTAHKAVGSYRLEFGSELEKIFTSSLSLNKRSGPFSISNLNARQELTIEHSDRLASAYQYVFSQASALETRTTSHVGKISLDYIPLDSLTTAFGLTGGISSLPQGKQQTVGFSGQVSHRLYESLTTSFSLRADLAVLPDGAQKSYGQTLNLAYTKKIPGGVKLAAGIGLGYNINDSRFENAERFVFQERLVAGFGPPLMLAQSHVLADTVLVTDLSGTTVYRPGVDYILSSFGEFTEITVLPTGFIADGQTLLVSYRHQFSPSAKFSSLSWQHNISLDYKGINAYYSHESATPKLISGLGSLALEETSTDTVGIRFSRGGKKTRLNLLNEYKKVDSSRLAYSSFQFSQFFNYIPTRTINLTLSFNESFQEFEFPERKFTNYSGRATFSWRPDLPLSLEFFTGFRIFKGEVNLQTYDLGVRLKSSLSYGETEFSPWLEYSFRSWGGTTTKLLSTGIKIIRRF